MKSGIVHNFSVLCIDEMRTWGCCNWERGSGVVNLPLTSLQFYDSVVIKKMSAAFLITPTDMAPPFSPRGFRFIGYSDDAVHFYFSGDLSRCSSGAGKPLSVLRVFISVAVICSPIRPCPCLVASSNAHLKHTHAHTHKRHTHSQSLRISTQALHLSVFVSCVSVIFPLLLFFRYRRHFIPV